MIKLIEDLWFKRRDIISDGFDESLAYIAKKIPVKVVKVQTGKKCWTWKVPEKWTVKEAYIEDLKGNRILDSKTHPLHVMSYSLSVDTVVARDELIRHLHTSQQRPKAIPYEFKYYERDWGFCIQHERLKELKEEKYRVFIDAKFDKGYLKIGEYTVKGETEETIVLVAHLCHPAMANDDLTGIAVLIEIAKEIRKLKRRYSYKFLIVPETIGSIAYLSQNERIIPKLKYGIFLEMLGNSNNQALQLTRQGNTRLDRICRYVLKRNSHGFREGAFCRIIRNDEIVFNGPGINVPMVSISRFPYPEYHTSDDNLGIISEDNLIESKNTILEILNILEKDYIPKRKFKGPVFLSGYRLWTDWRVNRQLNFNIEQIMLNVEGDKSVFDIAQHLDMEFNDVLEYVNKFFEKGLIEKKYAKLPL